MSEEINIEANQASLRDWFESKMPHARELTISSLKRPGAGASNETFFIELRWRKAGELIVENLVIRWPPRGFSAFPRHGYDMKQQYMLMERLGGTAIPVPRTRWLEEDESVIGVPFYIVDQVPGWVPGDFPPYQVAGPLYEATLEDKTKIWWNAVDTIANIHTLDWEKAGLGFLCGPSGGKDFLERQIAYFEETFQLNEEPMPPILEATKEWLLENSFIPKYISLCWGDARLGNMIFRDTEVAAVLDWELAYIGDPESDLGWFDHIDWMTSVGRSSSPVPRLAGLPGMKETIAHYEQVTNRKVENFFYYQVFAVWRMAVIRTRMEKDERYMARSKHPKGTITRGHFEKLRELLGL